MTIILIGCLAPRGERLASEWKLAGTGITLFPPGDAVPSISSDAAYALCLKGVADCDRASPTAINLALATDIHSGELDANGKLHLTLDKTLVWAISWLGNATCFHGGGAPTLETPPPSPSSPPTPTASPQCDKIAFIDAKSGRFYFTESAGHQ
jgi:hypothetical protein